MTKTPREVALELEIQELKAKLRAAEAWTPYFDGTLLSHKEMEVPAEPPPMLSMPMLAKASVEDGLTEYRVLAKGYCPDTRTIQYSLYVSKLEAYTTPDVCHLTGLLADKAIRELGAAIYKERQR